MGYGNIYMLKMEGVIKMEDNPFLTLAAMTRSHEGSSLRLVEGTVTSLSPLVVDFAGIRITGNGLRVNAALLQRSIRNTTGNLPASVNCTYGSIHSISIQGGTLQYDIDLKVGDSLCLLTGDDQVFYVLCKVVTP